MKFDDVFEVAAIVRAHHERWDGKGYPDGLKKEQAPLGARILAVVDAYDAMTSNRAYRKAMSMEDALGQLVAGAGTQFDQRIVGVLCDVAEKGLFDHFTDIGVSKYVVSDAPLSVFPLERLDIIEPVEEELR